ncbi:MAG: von Willebrand factor protein [Planctomycetaceae bacterium]|nr:von Willebrand factor protein [Planctomycetaceae bacterium]
MSIRRCQILLMVLFWSCCLIASDLNSTQAKQESAKPLVAPFSSDQAHASQEAWAQHLKTKSSFTNKSGLELVLIPPGEYLRGSSPADFEFAMNADSKFEPEDFSNEQPQHRARITKPFFMSKFETTQGQIKKLLGHNNSWYSRARHGKEFFGELNTNRLPAEGVSWFDAVEFCNTLSELEGKPPCYELKDIERWENSIQKATVRMLEGSGYRLPTEAEWEYACRAGTVTAFHFGDELNGKQANVDGSKPFGTATAGPNLGRTTQVGSYAPNHFGLYDMCGNVCEWCQDEYDGATYDAFSNKVAVDPLGVANGEYRVHRGGSCDQYGFYARSAIRIQQAPDDTSSDRVGFRVVCSCGPVTDFGPQAAEDEEEPEYTAAEDLKDADFTNKRIATLIRNLSAKDPELRTQAVEVLGWLGSESRESVPKLIELLGDDVSYRPGITAGIAVSVSRQASDSLVEIGAEAVSPLSVRFGSLPAKIHIEAIFTARRLGPLARVLLSQFVKQYETEKDKNVRNNLLAAIAAIDPTGKTALPILIKALRQADQDHERWLAATWLTRSDFLLGVYWKERAAANRWLRNAPADTQAAGNALVSALSDQSAQVRGAAAQALSTYPETAKSATPLLLKLSKDNATYFRATSNHAGGGATVSDDAYAALALMHSESDQILPQLINPDPVLSGRNADLFFELVSFSKHPLDHLLPLLDSEQSADAMAAIARLGFAALPAIPKLESMLTYKKPRIAVQAKITLACIDPKGHPALVQSVQKLLIDERADARHFLEQIGPKNAFAMSLLNEPGTNKQKIDEMIQELDEDLRWTDMQQQDDLVQLGPIVVPHLVQTLQAPATTPRHRINCLLVLARLESRAAEAVSAILGQLKSEFPRVRESAAKALGSIASYPPESQVGLRKAMTDPRPFVRAAAAESCGAFGTSAAQVVPTLIKLLSDDYLDVRVAAASALGRLGSVAKNALPKLDELKDTENILLRDTVRDALAGIAVK